MLKLVTRSMRVKAAWMLAALYVVCVVSPALSFAFGAALNVSCLVDEDHRSGDAHIHSVRDASTPHVHADSQKAPHVVLEAMSDSFATPAAASDVSQDLASRLGGSRRTGLALDQEGIGGCAGLAYNA